MTKQVYVELRENLEREAAVVAELLEIVGDDAPWVFRTGMKALGDRAIDLAAFICRLETGEIPVKVAVVGDFSSGKSSFINNLLEDPTLCPGRPDPTTSLVTSFTYGAKERILHHRATGKSTTVTRERYVQLVQARGSKAAQTRFTFHLPHPLLKGLEILDTPGFNNQMNPADSDVTKGIMKDADAFIYLVDANTGTIAETGLQQVRQIRRESAEAPIYLLISKADQKADAALEAIKTRYRKEYADLFQVRILTYTTQEPRPSIDGQEDLEALFKAFHRDKVVLARSTLKRLLFAHKDLRLTQASPLQEDLAVKVSQLTQEIKDRKALLDKLTARAREAIRCVTEGISEELVEALSGSLLAEEATKAEDKGWFFTDGKIHFYSVPFRKAVQKLSSFDNMEEALVLWHRSLFGRRAPNLPELRAMCRKARVKAADVAVAATRDRWAEELEQNYEDVDDAQQALDELLEARCTALARTMKAQWRILSEAYFRNLGPAYLEDTCGELDQRRKGLRKGLQAWKALVKNMPKTPR